MKALEDAGLRYEIDEAEKSRGTLCATVWYPHPSTKRDIRLDITYPDAYPYFRPEVVARGETFGRHQDPIGKNLCLLERGSESWRVDDTLAGMLIEQMPKLLATAAANVVTPELAIQEDRQAEPFSEYYLSDPGAILIDTKWRLPSGVDSGFFQIGFVQIANVQKDCANIPLIRGAVLRILDEQKSEVIVAPEAWQTLYANNRFFGRWIKLHEPIRTEDYNEFARQVRRLDSQSATNGHFDIKTLRMRIWATLFPEQHGYRETGGLGWVFVVTYEGTIPIGAGGRTVPAPVVRPKGFNRKLESR
jgi:hypothetical protein